MKNKIIFRNIFTILLVIAFSLSAYAQTALTAAQVAQKTSAVISDAKGLYVSFEINGNGQKGKGVIKGKGNKFIINLPDVSIWYNGKDLFTYNKRTSETTVVNPTAEELLESNPLLYVKGAGKNFKYSFSPTKKQGKYVVDLTPNQKSRDIQKLTFTINSKTFFPEIINVKTGNGDLNINIKELKTSENFSPSIFEYPKNKFPNVEIVDLR